MKFDPSPSGMVKVDMNKKEPIKEVEKVKRTKEKKSISKECYLMNGSLHTKEKQNYLQN